jgi:hypothetical protein
MARFFLNREKREKARKGWGLFWRVFAFLAVQKMVRFY